MHRRSAVRNLVVASAGLFLRRLSAGSSPQEQQGIYTIHKDVRLVLLDVSVKSHDGVLVLGLSKEDFTVLEDGRPQKITVFDRGDVPVTVGILVDESRSMTPNRAAVLAAAQTFIEESNRQDEFFVLNFNDKVKPGLPPSRPFSDNLEELRSALVRGVPEGRTALNDAVVAGLQQLDLGKCDKKALVVISDGGDNASTHKRHEMLARVEGSIATIYTIGLFDAEDPDHDPGILRHIAKISGGEAYFPSRAEEMVALCHRIAKDIRTRYTIGYLPPAGNGHNSIRQVRVRVAAPGHAGLVTRTRTSYRYDQIEDRKPK